jgi:hypothetical protein
LEGLQMSFADIRRRQLSQPRLNFVPQPHNIEFTTLFAKENAATAEADISWLQLGRRGGAFAGSIRK